MDKNTYKEVKTDPTDHAAFEKRIRNSKDNRLITPQMYRKFYPKCCSVPNFYGPPKIH